MNKYFVEKLNASDDYFKITDIYFKSGSYVNLGQIIFTIESSKANIEVEVTESGYIYFSRNIGEKINVGELFYVISEEILLSIDNVFKPISINNNDNKCISNNARILMNNHNITAEMINKEVIKESDVVSYIERDKVSVDFNEELLIKHEKGKLPLIIIGAGGGAKMCIDALVFSTEFQIVGLLDDKVKIGTNILGIPVIGNLKSVSQLLNLKIENFVLAFGVLENRKLRFDVFQMMKKIGCKFPNILHANSIVEKSVKLGEGNVILAGANIGSCVLMGDLNYINNNALVSHDCILKDNIHIAPSATLASSIKIESHVLIGMNTTLYMGIKIGNSSTILNGLIINNDIGINVIQKNNN